MKIKLVLASLFCATLCSCNRGGKPSAIEKIMQINHASIRLSEGNKTAFTRFEMQKWLYKSPIMEAESSA